MDSRKGLSRSSSLNDHRHGHRQAEYPIFESRHCQQELGSFEFRFFSASSSAAAPGEMISADKIFSNGKMLPCDLDFAKNAKNRNSCSFPPSSLHNPAAPSPPAALELANRSSSFSSSSSGTWNKKKNSSHSVRSSASASASIVSTTCSSHWKEILSRLRNPNPRPRSSASTSDISDTQSCASSSQRFLFPDDFSMEPLLDPISKSAPLVASSQEHHRAPPKNVMGRVSSFDGRSSSRVYPSRSSSDHLQAPNLRRSSVDPHRRSLSSFFSSDRQHHHPHHHHQSVTPVLNMPVCMGEPLVVASSGLSSCSSAKFSRSQPIRAIKKKR